MDSEPGSISYSAEWILLGSSVFFACAVSMVCSLLEAALLSLTPSQLARIRRKTPQVGHICQELKHEIDRPIAVILICNTAAHTIGAAVAGAAFSMIYGQAWLWVFTLALTLVMVQYTEILPKTLGVRYNMAIMRRCAKCLKGATVIMRPLIVLVHLINRPFEFRKEGSAPTTADEISALASLARSSQQINLQQERMLKAIPQLSEQSAKQVMLPLENVSFISKDQSVIEAMNFAARDFHTRYPVCEKGNCNKIYGYVNFKELVSTFRAHPEHTQLGDLVRPILFVHPDDSLDEILERFSSQYCHMAIVRNTRGVVKGMLTLEDILEELLGDLEDEFDPLPRTFHSPSEGFWVVGGGMPVSVLARETLLDLPKKREPLAVWFANQCTTPLRVGVVFRHNNAEFYVRKIRRGRVLEFNVKRAMVET